MNLKKASVIPLLMASLGLTACDKNTSKHEDLTSYEMLCVNSGGAFDGSRCACGGITCEAGLLCNTITKTCPALIDPEEFREACTESGGTPDGSICSCGGTACAAWQICVDNQCPKAAILDFSELCAQSGGRADGDICSCAGTDCEAGVLCSTLTGQCPEFGGSQEIKAGDVCDSAGDSICQNNSSQIGQLLECDGSAYKARTCKDGENNAASCHGNSCGSCKNYTQVCEDQLNEENEVIGVVKTCQNGSFVTTIECSDVSCRKDLPVCGECINGALKCTDEKNLNVITLDNGNQITDDKLYAVMWRCTDGQWKRIQNQYDPIDPSYACPTYCQTTSQISVQQRVTKCYENAQHEEMCQACDPCAGSAYDSSRSTQLSNFNPCYDEARCAEIKKTEDPDYPPFRRDLNDERIYKKIYGYNYSYSPYTDMDLNYNPPADKMGEFYFDLTNNTSHLSCNPDKTYYGRCHNSLQNCINKSFQADGYIIQCVNGALMDYDNNDDELACYCANGTSCYTKRNCHKNTIITSTIRICARPESPESGYGENPIPMD